MCLDRMKRELLRRVLDLRSPNKAEVGEKNINSCGTALHPFSFGSYRKRGISHCLLYPPAPSDTLQIHFDSKTCIKVSI